MGRPRVSAIIANWNGAEHLRLCLPSLGSQSFDSLEIIVVDNGSSDESQKVAESHGVRWVPLESNLGLAPALNFGSKLASGDLLLFVNNDMRFDQKFVAALVEAMDMDGSNFATDGMQFNWDGTIRGHMAARLFRVRPADKSSTELVPGLYFSQREELRKEPVFMASAACMLVRRTYFEELGGFDSRLPLGYEDVEICWRAWTHRWKTIYVPGAICWHRIGASGTSQEGARFNFRGVLIGRLLFSTKLLPIRYALGTWLVSTVALGKDLGRRRWMFAKERIRILWQMARLLRRLLQERKEIFARAKISPGDHLNFLLGLTKNASSGDLTGTRARENG